MKVVVLLLDGLADRPSEELGGMTPLEVAHTPNLDKVATLGSNGLMHTISPFLAPSTDLAHFVMFGYKPEEYPGRGWVEALGNNIIVKDDQVVLRDLFVTAKNCKDGWIIERENVVYEEEECIELSKEIAEYEKGDFSVRHIYTGERHGFLIISGPASPLVTDTDPFVSSLPVMESYPLLEAEGSIESSKTADFLNEYTKWAHSKLSNHSINKMRIINSLPPINFLVAKWPGKPVKIDSFYEVSGFKGAICANTSLLKGLSKMLKIDYVEIPKGLLVNQEIEILAKSAKDLLKQGYDFIFLHTKLLDESAHKKNPYLKQKIIEETDGSLSIFFELGICDAKDLVFVLTTDHATPSTGTLIHSGEPVPLAIISKNLLKDEVSKFSERAAFRGIIGTILGKDFLPLILNITDRTQYLGSRAFSKPWPAKPSLDRINPLRLDDPTS